MIPTGGRKSGNWYQFHYIYIVTNHQNNLHDPKKALGPYGRATRPEAIVPNPAVNNFKGIYGGHAGLKLLVPKSYTVIRGEKYLVGAESDSTRNDMFYGTFGLRSRRVPRRQPRNRHRTPLPRNKHDSHHDGEQVWTISNITLFPQEVGHLVITHWSNGDLPYFFSDDVSRNATFNRTVCEDVKKSEGVSGSVWGPAAPCSVVLCTDAYG